MKFTPEHLIKDGRFRILFDSSDKETQELVIKKLGELLDGSVYTEESNYGHLCNLYSALAFCLVFEAQGKSRKEGIETVKRAMYDYLVPERRKMEQLAAEGKFIDYIKGSMPPRFGSPVAFGWDVDFEEKNDKEFVMTVNSCMYCKIFKEYGIEELTPVFCGVDDLLFKDLPGAGLEYTQQMGCGGNICDYVFKNYR